MLTALANVQALFFLTSIFAGVGTIVLGNGGYLAVLAWLVQREGPRALCARYRGAMEIGFGALFVAFVRTPPDGFRVRQQNAIVHTAP